MLAELHLRRSGMFSPFTFPSVLWILGPLGNGNEHLLLAAAAHFCIYSAAGSHRRPPGEQELGLTNLKRRFARRAQNKITLGWIWKEERREEGGGVVREALHHCFDRISLVFFFFHLSRCQNEMKAQKMRS